MKSKRTKFFLAHFSTSLIIAIISMIVVFYLWYPMPLAKAVGMIPLFLMMLIIDIIIGPILGLFVYKEGKKTLKMDLAVVILLQVLAFGYGVYSLEKGRPAWLVYNGLSFDLVKKSDIEKSAINRTEAQFQYPSLFYPTYVGIDSTSLKNNQDSLTRLTEGVSETITRNPVYYTDIKNSATDFQKRALPLSLLEKYNDPAIVKSITAQYPTATGWLGLSAPSQDMVVLIDKDKGEIVKIVDLRPWQ